MKEHTNKYTCIFAFIVCLFCSLTLAIVSEGLKEKQKLNEQVDIKKNILKALGIATPLKGENKIKKILELYEQKVEEFYISEEGQLIKAEGFPLFVYKEKDQVLAYCFPLEGKGLWSTIYGYLSLEADAQTVRGITFYKHGETPGLGAEIEKEWFQNNFIGKKIWDADLKQFVAIKVIKGKVVDKIKNQKQRAFYVDGISGATMTSKGVSAMLDKEIKKYAPFFKRIKAQAL